MSAIVPYGAIRNIYRARRVFGKARTYGTYARAAFKVGKMAYRSYAGRKRRGGRLKRRAKFARTSTKQLGFPAGASNTKRNAVHDGATLAAYNSRTFYNDNLVAIGKVGTLADEIDKRQRDLCKVSGVKICMTMENKGSLATDVLEVNVAVITARDTVISPAVTDFFRSSDTFRATSFSTALSSTQLDCLPINTDKWIVHKRWKRRLLPSSTNSNGRNFGRIQHYLKIGKQFRFDGTVTAPTTPVPYLVWWYDKPNTDGGAPVVTAQMDMTHRCVVYFKESKV